MSNTVNSVGDFMASAKKNALKALAIFLALVVYAGMLLYTGVHNYSLMTRGLIGDMLFWAILGVVALELSGIGFPLALHFWTFDTTQRYATFFFYFVDISLLVLNTVLDYSVNAHTSTAAMEWMQLYYAYIVPVTPIIAGVSWTIIFLLDPSSKESVMKEELKASTRATLAKKVNDAAKEVNITRMVEVAAANLVEDIVRGSLGHYYASPLPPGRAPDHQPMTMTEMMEEQGYQPSTPAPAPRPRPVAAAAKPGDNHKGHTSDFTTLDLNDMGDLV